MHYVQQSLRVIEGFDFLYLKYNNNFAKYITK